MVPKGPLGIYIYIYIYTHTHDVYIWGQGQPIRRRWLGGLAHLGLVVAPGDVRPADARLLSL